MLPKITVPTVTFKVPSSGQELTIRQMVSREEKILLMAKESAEAATTDTDDVPKAIRQICVNCVVAPQVDIDNSLTTFDLQALFMKIYSFSVSNISKLGWIDRADEKEYSFDVELDKVPVRFEDTAKLPYQVKVSHDVVMNLRYPKSKIFVDSEYINAKDKTDYMIRAVIDQVISAGQQTKFENESPKDQMEFIDSFPISVRNSVIEFLTKIPTLYYKIEYENSKGTQRSIELKTLADFFTL